MSKVKDETTPRKKIKKKNIKVDVAGRVYITASFNNVIITFTNQQGKVISWSTAGKMGFRGAKKATPYAAQVAAMDAGKVAFSLGMSKCEVLVKGPGVGRESAIRAIANLGIHVAMIRDITGIPHNGCRPPKRRRV